MNDRAKPGRGARSAAAGTTLPKSACDRLPVGFALFDARFRLAAWNARFAALRGYPRKLVKADTPLESFVRLDAERGEYGEGAIDALTRTKLAALKRGRPAKREQALPDGRCLRIACERVPEGGLLLTCEDVTDARRAARRLRESEERYDFAMRAINEGVYDWDLASDVVHYSDRAWHAVGLSPEDDFTARRYFARIHPDDQPKYRNATIAHFKGETERFECDYRYRVRDGSWRWARQHGIALRDATGRAVRLIGSTGDITELKERERQLAEQTAEQTAVRELLEAISRSAFDLDAVLRTLIESAARLCRAERAFIFRLDGDVYRLSSDYGGVTPEFREFVAQHPVRAGRDTLVGRTALTRQVVHIEDVLADPEYRWPQSQRIGGFRTMLGVPIVRDGTVIGVIALWKERVEPFTATRIQLVSTFSSQASIAIENARLFGEMREALEQQTATAQILRVMSESPGDLDPVFRAILERATALCDAQLGIVFRWDGERYHVVATRGEDVDAIARWKEAFAAVGRPGPHSGLGRLLVDKQPVHIPDILEEAAYREGDALRLQTASILKARSFLAVPLLKNEAVIGAVVIYRHEVRPFSARQVELVKVFADQAVIAIENVRLFNELQARNRELSESLEQQTATAEILKVISGSPTDVQPVFDAIVKSGVHLFQGVAVSLRLVKGDRIEGAAFAAGPGCEVSEDLARPSFPLDERTSAGRAVLRREVIHVPDVFAEDWFAEEGRKHAERMGWRSVVAAPMLRDGKPLGAILVVRAKAAPFSGKEIALLKTFADQAVIAIENVRLFNELQTRNSELTGALDREKATAEILRVISSSPTDIQPVLDAVAERAGQLCDSPYTNVLLADGDKLKVMSVYSTEPGPRPDRGNFVPIDRTYLNGRALLDRQVVHIADIVPLVDTEFPDVRRNQRKFGFRAVLVVPLMREGRAVGTIFLWRREPGLFSDDQVVLLKTFAEQAVIAIENVRLFNELQARNRDLSESLEQQTATAEILRVISSSPTNIAPVLDAVAENAARLCEANDVVVMMNEGDVLRAVKSSGPFGERFGAEFTIPITRGSAAGRAVVERATVQVADFASESDEEYPVGREHQRIYGNHGAMATPLLRGDAVLGVIAVLRRDVRPFNDRQRALLQTFADQAAIAIANVRLFNETKEALEQQTATAEILRVISSSPTDLAPVFDAVARSAARLCDAPDVVIIRAEGESMRFAASVGPFGQTFGPDFTIPITRGSVAGRAVLERRTIQVHDLAAESGEEYPVGKDLQRRYGHRTMVAAPLLLGETALGAIAMLRTEVRPYSQKQLALLRTFADQAVIAIENVRLFNETKEALERQTATAEILKVIAGSPTNVQPAFEAIAQSAHRLFSRSAAFQIVRDGALHIGALAGFSDAGVKKAASVYPLALEESRRGLRAMRAGKVLETTDVQAPGTPPAIVAIASAAGFRSIVTVPLLRGDELLGQLSLTAEDVRPRLDDKQLGLLKTFADQAVIAIENVRLFNETKEALDQLKASAEVLQVISSSVADTKPVFDKILESCERLFEGRYVGITLVGDDGAVHLGPYRGPERRELESMYPLPLSTESGSGSAILARRVMHYPDVEGGADVPEPVRRGSRIIGSKSIIFSPMLWEGRGIGTIFVCREAAGEFSEKEIALLKTFADQAVIAIQNARLFHEIQEKSHQLEIANQHKSAFLANMSHELRTPLNAVIGFSEMLAARYFGDLTAKQAEYVSDIHGSGKHLLSLINDILDLSKIEAGRMDLELAAFDLRVALDNALTLVRERAQRGGVALTLEANPALAQFEGDERKLKQVVLNLLSNAVKFTPRGGAVSVTAKRTDGVVEIAVSDTGAGIAPEDQEAIFEAFRQVGTDVTRKREGTGLGLALTRRFVELHGGTIRVESAVGKGSTFTVRLPIRHGE